jgi:hypothetical protein
LSYVVIMTAKGPACPRCGRPMQIREHDRIRAKQLRQPFYYSRWFRCMHKGCKTKIVHREEFKVWNDGQEGELARRLEAILEQLKPRS